MNKLYLAYGSNLNLAQMSHRCPTAKVVGATALQDYQLLFRGRNGNAVATVEPLKGSSVPVLIWEITPADEVALDRYEGHPHLYRKEDVIVKLNGKRTIVMVYIMNEIYNYGLPNEYYYNTILEGYTSAGFDEKLLKRAVENSNR